ncbi:hypothetical protein THRCLA_21704 [Thraustotheca clavata]|uniref:Transmembrane protein n=1 Tax=Thraustotheca clavata TaxID=74557 RepID=A0A1V9ZQK0_9STRA|nr:hypothetical protein THRCLA_21704 [Thraustotheca clavata]
MLKYYLVLAGLLEIISFLRLLATNVPFEQLLPTVDDSVFDTVPVVRRLYGVYVLTLGILRLTTARDMRNRSLFGVLAITHVLETLFSFGEVFVFQGLSIGDLVMEKHILKGVMLVVLNAQMIFMIIGYFWYCGGKDTMKKNK